MEGVNVSEGGVGRGEVEGGTEWSNYNLLWVELK